MKLEELRAKRQAKMPDNFCCASTVEILEADHLEPRALSFFEDAAENWKNREEINVLGEKAAWNRLNEALFRRWKKK